MIKWEHDVNFDAISFEIIVHSRTKRNGEKTSKSADNGRKHGSFGTQKLITIDMKGTDDSRIDESETIRRTEKIVDHNNTNMKMETMRTGRWWQAHIDFHSMLSAHVYLSFNGAMVFMEWSLSSFSVTIFSFRAFAQRCTVICACGMDTVSIKLRWHRFTVCQLLLPNCFRIMILLVDIRLSPSSIICCECWPSTAGDKSSSKNACTK